MLAFRCLHSNPEPVTLTLIQVNLVEVLRPGDVHVVKTRDLVFKLASKKAEELQGAELFPTYIAMAAEMLQQFNLSQSTFGQNPLAKHIRDFLDGDAVIGLDIGGGTFRWKTCQQVLSLGNPGQELYRSISEG